MSSATEGFRGSNEYDITRLVATPDLVRQSYPWAISAAYQREGAWIYDWQNEGLWRDSQIWEKVRYDLVLAGGIENRLRHVGGTQAEVIAPPGDDSGDKFAATMMGHLFKDIPYYSGSRKMLAEADFLGEQWMAMPGQWVKKLLPGDTRPRRWWQMTQLKHVDKRRFRLVPVADPKNMEHIRTAWQLWSPRRMRWETLSKQARQLFIRHTHEEREDGLGYARGLLASLFHWWRLKTLVLEYGLKATEIYAKGIINASINGLRLGDTSEDNQAQVQKWIEVVRALADAQILVHDTDEDWKVEWPQGSIADIPLKWAEYFDGAALRLIQAGDITTGMSGAKGGSFAALQGMRKGSEEYFSTPRERLQESLNSQQMRRAWRMNRKPMQEALQENGHRSARAPSVALDTPTSADPKEAVELIEGMQKVGMRVGRQWAHDLIGAPMIDEDEDVLEPVKEEQPGGGMFPGFGNGNGNGQPFGADQAQQTEDKDEPTAVGEGDQAEDNFPQLNAAARLQAEGGKVDKTLVSYTDEAPHNQQCQRCRYWLDGYECALVGGPIDPGGWCELWRAAGGARLQADDVELGGQPCGVGQTPAATNCTPGKNGDGANGDGAKRTAADAEGVAGSIDKWSELQGATDDADPQQGAKEAATIAVESGLEFGDELVSAALERVTALVGELASTSANSVQQLGAAIGAAVANGARSFADAATWSANFLANLTQDMIVGASAGLRDVILGAARMVGPWILLGAAPIAGAAMLTAPGVALTTQAAVTAGLLASTPVFATVGEAAGRRVGDSEAPELLKALTSQLSITKHTGKGARQMATGLSEGWQEFLRQRAERTAGTQTQADRGVGARLDAGDVNRSCKALIPDGNGRFLLLKDNGTPWWDLPGGHMSEGETREQALSREVREECGMTVRDGQHLFTETLKLGNETRPVDFFKVDAVGDVKLSDEHTEARWVTPEEAAELDTGAFAPLIERLGAQLQQSTDRWREAIDVLISGGPRGSGEELEELHRIAGVAAKRRRPRNYSQSAGITLPPGLRRVRAR